MRGGWLLVSDRWEDRMRRWMVAVLAAMLVLSVAAGAFADDDVDGVDADDVGELNDKQLQRAEDLASYFAPRFADEDAEVGEVESDAVDLTDQVVEFRTGDDRVGWGALYKLLLLAEYRGEDLTTVVENLRSDGGWGFGKNFKELRSDAEWAESSDTPMNFGQWKKHERTKSQDD